MCPDLIPILPTAAFKRFPPRWGHIMFPVGSRRGALAGIALYPACARRAVWFQGAVYAWTAVLGPRFLPWRSERWKPPVEEETWRGLRARWQDAAGGFDTFAISERRPVSRAGFMVLLLRQDRPVGFVKVRHKDEALAREFQALERVAAFGPRTFTAPEPVEVGEVQDWSFLVMGPLEPGIHKMPGNPALDRITAEISGSLEGFPRPEGTPEHWRPMHGDFTPWNLRKTPGGGLILMDWEYASWAPPRADEILYRATLSMLGHERPSRLRAPEAVDFWKRRIPERAGHYGKGFTEALLARIEVQARRSDAEGASHNAAGPVEGSAALRRR